MDLPEFINARLAEAEAAARAVRPGALYAYEEGGGDGWAVEGTDGSPGAIIGDRALAEHIAAWDPAHVLAWCAAMRAAVETCTYYLHNDDRGADPCAAAVLAHLALAWDAHPDFDPAWR